MPGVSTILSDQKSVQGGGRKAASLPKLIFFTNHLRGPKGEAGARSWHQAKALQDLFSVDVVMPAVDPVSGRKVVPELYSGLDDARVCVHLASGTRNDRSSKSRRAIFYLTTAFSQLLKGLKVKNPDAILSMSLTLPMLLSALLIAKIRRVKLFVDVRDMPFEVAEEVGYLKKGWFLSTLKFAESYCLNRAEKVFTVSPAFVDYIEDKGVSPENIEYAPIGYDNFAPPSPSFIREWRAKLESQFKPSVPQYIIIYTGTFGHVVEVDIMLDAAALLKDDLRIGFIFVGDGQKKDEYIARVEQENIRAAFIGRVNKSDVQAICRCADFCLYASREGRAQSAMLGNKVFDYLGASRAVIYAGPDSEVKNILLELETGEIVSDPNSASIVEAVISLIEDKDKRARYEQNAAGLEAHGYLAKNSAQHLAEVIWHAL